MKEDMKIAIEKQKQLKYFYYCFVIELNDVCIDWNERKKVT